MRNLSILGSTGSIGRQTLEIVRADSDFRVTALAALKNSELMAEQIAEFRPDMVCMYDNEAADRLKQILNEKGLEIPKILSGIEGLEACAVADRADTVVAAVVGMIGIRPVIAAINAGKDIALANKETLVCAGHIIMPLAARKGIRIAPVDSEHSAVWQCLTGERHADIAKIILTASGGPFRGYTAEKLRTVTKSDALKHPNWSMGAKITVDSATMVNKALEVIEAHYLFDVPYDDIQIIVQPQSVIHSMVQFRDGAVKAQLGVPSMLIPIAYALYAPVRHELPADCTLDFTALSGIDFSVPDPLVFRGLELGIRAAYIGGTMPTVFNAANEEAVALFLGEQIGFTDIADAIEEAMDSHTVIPDPGLEEIFRAEASARNAVRKKYKRL